MRGQGLLDSYMKKKLKDPSAVTQSGSEGKQEGGGYLIKKPASSPATPNKDQGNISSQKKLQFLSEKKGASTECKLSKSGKYILSGGKNLRPKDEVNITDSLSKNTQKKTINFSGVKANVENPSKQSELLKPREKKFVISSLPKEKNDSSDTEQLDGSLKIEVLNSLSSKRPPGITFGPFDTIFCDDLYKSLEQLMLECTKSSILSFIKQRNMCLGRYNNLSNIQKIRDDQFWCLTMQKTITLLLQKKHVYNSCIRTLSYTGQSQRVTLSRLQIYMLVASMFLSIVPPQFHTEQTSFYDLMSLKSSDETNKQKPIIRLEKLKCIINYLKIMSENEELYNETVTFERAISYNKEYLRADKETPLRTVEVRIGQIEEGYGDGVIVDFANAAVGGGFLGNGCAQEEILFSIMPELTVIKVFSQSIREEEAIVVRGARHFNQYQGYSHSFKFQGNYSGENNTQRSVIVAVDAVDFTKGLLNKSHQYSRKFILRELHKMFVGIDGADSGDEWKPQKVYTGRWGCGVFGADEYLKFCIQWIVCSHCELDMIFMTKDENTKKELEMMVSNLTSRSTYDLLCLLEEYGREGKYSYGLLNFFKDYA